MRFLAPLAALLILCAPTRAQSIEDAFSLLTSFASVAAEDEDDGGGCYESCIEPFNPIASIPPEDEGICTGFSNTQLVGIVGIAAGSLGLISAALYCGYGDEFCNDPCLTGAIPRSAQHVTVLRSPEDGSHPLLLEVVHSQSRGVGDVSAPAAITVRAFDAETRQPVALGPLGSTTATVRTADDLRALLGSPRLGTEAEAPARRDP
ncbi:MAG: hypothetical protein AAGI52_09725 [Bacteroidota bacterium]